MQNLLLTLLLLLPFSAPILDQPEEPSAVMGIPVASDYTGYWSGDFDAPADLWWFIWDIKLDGTWMVYQYYPPTMTWTLKTGTWSLDSSGTLRGLNVFGNPAFSMFPHSSNPNLMTAEMVNTQGPGIPGLFYDGVIYP